MRDVVLHLYRFLRPSKGQRDGRDGIEWLIPGKSNRGSEYGCRTGAAKVQRWARSVRAKGLVIVETVQRQLRLDDRRRRGDSRQRYNTAVVDLSLTGIEAGVWTMAVRARKEVL